MRPGGARSRPPARSALGPLAERLAAIIPRARLHPSVVAWADARGARERWGVAFSGGADSLCLLLLLWAHWPGRRDRLVALHFNHRLRGAASDGDARFCRDVCRRLGVAFASGRWAAPRRRASEAEAREARFGFFDRQASARRLGALWLGHQRDDVAETMLMRLARGSGAPGLAAPRPVQAGPGERVRLRPLLACSKEELMRALRSAGLSWREDASNAGDRHFRNRIRRKVLPAWNRAAGRDALSGAARSRELLEEDDDALEVLTDRIDPVTPAGRLNLDKLSNQPKAIIRRALHRWLLRGPRRAALSRQGFEALLEMVERRHPARFSLGTRGFAVIRGRWLEYA